MHKSLGKQLKEKLNGFYFIESKEVAKDKANKLQVIDSCQCMVATILIEADTLKLALSSRHTNGFAQITFPGDEDAYISPSEFESKVMIFDCRSCPMNILAQQVADNIQLYSNRALAFYYGEYLGLSTEQIQSFFLENGAGQSFTSQQIVQNIKVFANAKFEEGLLDKHIVIPETNHVVLTQFMAHATEVMLPVADRASTARRARP